jgi:hypothetical protein
MTKNGKQIKYMPILKWKPAEEAALAELTDKVRSQILPLVEIQTPSVKRDSNGLEQPPKHLFLHLQTVALELARSWGIGSSVVVDVHALPSGPLQDLGGQTARPSPVKWCSKNGQRSAAVPV